MTRPCVRITRKAYSERYACVLKQSISHGLLRFHGDSESSFEALSLCCESYCRIAHLTEYAFDFISLDVWYNLDTVEWQSRVSRVVQSQ